MTSHIPLSVSVPIDLASAGAILTSLLGYIPPFGAVLAVIWYMILLYEYFKKRNISPPVKKKNKRHKVKNKLKIDSGDGT